MPQLRTAWNGLALGQANASEDRRRKVTKYSFGFLCNFTPPALAAIANQKDHGTTQRFILFASADPSIPDVPPALQKLALKPGDWNKQPFVTFPGHINEELWRRRLEKNRGNVSELHRSQELLMRCKVAACLALMYGRYDVTDQDYQLAMIIIENTYAIFEIAEAFAKEKQDEVIAERAESFARCAVARQVAVGNADDKLASAVRTLVAVVEAGVTTPGKMKNKLTSSNRYLFDDALETAVKRGLLLQVENGHYRRGR